MSDKTIYDFADSENIIEIYNAILNRKLNRFPKDTWIPVDKGLMNARLVTKYLIENVLQWSEEDVINNLHYYVFVQYNLGGMLGRVFHGSTFNALDNAYPGKYDAKQMEQTFLGEYDFDNEIQRLRSILKNHSHEEIIKIYGNSEFVFTHRFQSLIRQNDFNKFGLLNFAFPDEFKEWEFRIFDSADFWNNKDNRLDAIYWLMDKKQTICITSRDFSQYGLNSLLNFYEVPKTKNALKEALHIPERSEFVRFLKQWQEKSSLTQKEFAQTINVHFGTFYNWCNGHTVPSFFTVLKLCEYMKIDLRKNHN